MDNKYQAGFHNPPKLEVTNIPLDPERLEIVKKILEQNQMILDFVLYSPPNNLFLNVNSSNSKLDFANIADEVKENLQKVGY